MPEKPVTAVGTAMMAAQRVTFFISMARLAPQDERAVVGGAGLAVWRLDSCFDRGRRWT
jgi:hypothetical protein